MSTNEYGLDVSYFKAKLQRILNEVERYTPDELARECARMSTAIDKAVVLEDEFQSTDALNPPSKPHIEGILAVCEWRYESGFAEVKELGLEDGSKAQKAFWHALEFCNDPENRNIRQHWENYKQLLQEQAT